MNFLKQLLEFDLNKQAELETKKELADSGFTDLEQNKAVVAKKTKEKQKQLTNLSQSQDPIDRQILALRRQIALLLQKKQAKLDADAKRATV